MYEILKIVQKNEEVFELFLVKKLDGDVTKERIEVLGTVLSALGILKPQPITADIYQVLNEKKQYYLAYTKAIQYLSYRKRSVEEVRQYLLEKEITTAPIVKEVIEKLLEQQYLDDADFVQSYITTALKTTLKGPEKLRQELTKLGCDGELIANTLTAKIEIADEVERLTQIYAKMTKKKYLSQKVLIQKFEQKASTLGYHYTTINISKKQLPITDIIIDNHNINRILQKEYQKAQKKELSSSETKFLLKQKLITKQIDYNDAEQYVQDWLTINVVE